MARRRSQSVGRKLGQPLELTRTNRDTRTANRTTRRNRPEPEERKNQTQRNQPPAKHRTKLDRTPSRTPKLPRRNCPRVIPRHQPELETQTPGPDMLMPQPSHPPENKMLSHAFIYETAFYFQVGGAHASGGRIRRKRHWEFKPTNFVSTRSVVAGALQMLQPV